jgi:hypothetical protein
LRSKRGSVSSKTYIYRRLDTGSKQEDKLNLIASLVSVEGIVGMTLTATFLVSYRICDKLFRYSVSIHVLNAGYQGKVIPKPDNERDILNMQFPNDEENQPLITGSGDISIFVTHVLVLSVET